MIEFKYKVWLDDKTVCVSSGDCEGYGESEYEAVRECLSRVRAKTAKACGEVKTIEVDDDHYLRTSHEYDPLIGMTEVNIHENL